MFYAVTRKDYQVNAEEEARQIQERTRAHKVAYRGARVFIVFETAADVIQYQICQNKYGTSTPCSCWAGHFVPPKKEAVK